MPRKTRTFLLASAVIFVVAVLAALFLSAGRTPPRPTLPNPNGYDDFLKAAALVTGDVGNFPTLSNDRLRALVSTNAESLRLLRLGLTRQSALPAHYAMTNVSGMLSDLAATKKLVQLLAAEGRLREMDNRLADAARSYVDAIHLGNEISRGGLIINRLVGIACEAIGDTPLSQLAPRLDSKEAHAVMAELEKIDHAGVTWDEIRENENSFLRYQLSKSFNPIAWGMARWQDWRSGQKAELKHKKIAARVRLLTVELAVLCFQSEQGRAPTSLEQLVPNYLQRVPSDPFSEHALVYRPQGTNWLLYSVGEDGVDDGGIRAGRPVSGTVAKGDLFYDSPY